MPHKKLTLESSLFKDTLEIVIGPKNVIFRACIDEAGNEFKISRKKLTKLVK